ncbi:uncharacterized protein TNCV_4034181 [Trichonephila clavipes]|nr:uncharacterized protein TNCV_4034181 [Trichonephila clavipes]
MCKADVRKGLEDGLAIRLPLSEPREIYKDKLETDNRSNIGSEFTFEMDLPQKRDRSTIYRLNLIKLYQRKPELANLVMENSSEGIDSETLYSVKLFMDFGFQGNLRKSQVYFKLPPDRSSYLRMINAKKKERFLPESGTIVLRQKDINLVTRKPFRIKTCCSSQMLINSLREDTEYLLDLGVNGMGQSNRTLPVVLLGRVNRYPYPRIKCVKYRNLKQVLGFHQLVKDKCDPSIVPEFLRATSCGMTSARGHGAIVYCLNSGMLCEGYTRNRWRDGQVCPDVDKELWRLGPDGSGEKKETRERERTKRVRRERTKRVGREWTEGEGRGEDRRDGERKGLSPELEDCILSNENIFALTWLYARGRSDRLESVVGTSIWITLHSAVACWLWLRQDHAWRRRLQKSVCKFKMQQSMEQRYAIKFCVHLGKSGASTLEMIQQVYDRESLSQAQVF